MKRSISAAVASLLAVSALCTTASAAEEVSVTAFGFFAKPVIEVTMPKSMSFVFNPYSLNVKANAQLDRDGSKSKIVCSYVDSDDDAWVITNNSDIAVRIGTYAYAYRYEGSDFSVRDKNLNSVDTSDDTCKYLFLDISISGGSSGTQKVKLLNELLRTDEEEYSYYRYVAGWWSEENSDVVTVVHDVAKGGKVRLTMDGTTQNVGDIPWSRSDKTAVYFVFTFDAEPTTGR